MRTIYLDFSDQTPDFNLSKKIADALAKLLVEQSLCISWYDRERQLESPSHVSECATNCKVPGVVDYARNRGARLMVDIGKGAFIFCYRSADEFPSAFA
jgi:hypothetical protein